MTGPRRLDRLRRLAVAVLVFEQAWPALWPALGVAGVFVCAALLGLPALLAPPLRVVLALAALLAMAWMLRRGLRQIRLPDRSMADRRLERASGLRHRPLSALADRPAGADPAATLLWQAHVARAAGMLGRLRVGLPHPGLAARDRYALRCALVVALVAAVVIAGGDAWGRLAGAVFPTLPHAAPVPAAELHAWATPPAYTGLPPLFLPPQGGPVTLPAGSHLTVGLTGGAQGVGVAQLEIAGRAQDFDRLDETSFQADLDLNTGGRFAVRRGGDELAAWQVTILIDQPPTASFPEPPGPAGQQQGRAPRLRLPWQCADDYGVVTLQAELRLRERPSAPPLLVPIPLPSGSPKSAHGTMLLDLSASPWAGLAVIGRLVARDAPGQRGESEAVEFTLPERIFQHPVAQRLMELRKALALHPEAREPVAAGLAGLAEQPQAFEGDTVVLLVLRATAALLMVEPAETAVDEAAGRMWQLALRLDEGTAERTERALTQAREAAREALEAAERKPDPETKAELDRKLQELEQAIRNHLEALREEARREQEAQPQDRNAPKQDSQALQRKAEAAREAARKGKMDEAKQQLAELDKMLQQLRNARAEHDQQAQKNGEQRKKGRQQMSAVQDLVKRQGGVLDHVQSRDAAQQGTNADPRAPGQPEPGEGPQADAERETDRRVQQALRRALGELMQQVGDLTGEIPKGLGEADQAMRQGAEALAHGEDAAAGAAAEQAIEALQQGARELSQQLAKQSANQQSGESSGQDEGDQDSNTAEGQLGSRLQDGTGTPRGGQQRSRDHGRDARRDPLGRHLREGTSGSDEGSDVAVPDQMELQRTQAIQDELRRRGAERSRPQPELDYIDRLLKQF